MMRGWTAPPTRRELLLLVFSLTVFVCAYNADVTLAAFGFGPASLSPFARARPPAIGPDGRKPAPYRDALEDQIVGTWDWEPGHVAGVNEAEALRTIKGVVEEGDVYIRGEGRAGQQALWLQGVGQGRYASDPRLGSTTINDEFIRWGDHVPRTKILFHIPGFTILENVTLAFGTFFLVTDDPSTMPPPGALGSSKEDHALPPRDIDWQILPASNSIPKLGTFGSRMHGTSFVSYDAAIDAHTLLSLTRLHSVLNTTTPPSRLILPSVHTFVDPLPDPTIRTPIGIPHATLIAAYPTLTGPLYYEDFDDFTGLSGPVLLDRVVLVDRGAAARASPSPSTDTPTWASIFAEPRGAAAWFEPVRATLWAFFGLDEAGAPRTDEITYLAGAHPDAALAAELKRLGHPLHIVDNTTPWRTRMAAVVRSSIIVGPSGAHLSDAAFLRPGPRAALVELFPDGAFDHNWATIVRSMGHAHIAFQGTRRIDPASPPSISRPSNAPALKTDAKAVAQALRDLLARH
ncbi:hypothetical protein K488DRAFT_48953 [Vararia minispora EC-137]|uniref:Uncharacterized protein n=1 Tax=Vararia minispora EC-137 TaxID=1314806 RepID=A0ACB8QM31_9AGAM|nr:hypothetical protein K488DRAFT_48953 [Vararia minispora EC-137]